MGINGCQCIAGSLRGNHLEMLCRHIEHEVTVMGAEHVGYGFDLCDSYDEAGAALRGESRVCRNDCLLNHGQIPLVTAALLQRGMDEGSVRMRNVSCKSSQFGRKNRIICQYPIPRREYSGSRENFSR